MIKCALIRNCSLLRLMLPKISAIRGGGGGWGGCFLHPDKICLTIYIYFIAFVIYGKIGLGVAMLRAQISGKLISLGPYLSLII
jgi:hypothetical protein